MATPELLFQDFKGPKRWHLPKKEARVTFLSCGFNRLVTDLPSNVWELLHWSCHETSWSWFRAFGGSNSDPMNSFMRRYMEVALTSRHVALQTQQTQVFWEGQRDEDRQRARIKASWVSIRRVEASREGSLGLVEGYQLHGHLCILCCGAPPPSRKEGWKCFHFVSLSLS